MVGSELKAGAEYAFRERPNTRTPLTRITLIQHVRGARWKAKWIDTHPGLVDYVTTRQIIVPWKEHKQFLQEEKDLACLREHNLTSGYKEDSPVTDALQQIFETAGDGISYDRGILRTSFDAVNRVRSRCRLPDYELKLPAYQCRDGSLRLPHDQAEQLGRAFCMAEPAPVLVDIEATERKWATETGLPGNEFQVPLLNQYRASWALIRQWCGFDAAIAERDKRIESLERLVWDAIYALQRAGLTTEAVRLRQTIKPD